MYVKNFMWEDQRRKRCYIAHKALRSMSNAILFIYRAGYAYSKEPKGFQKVSLGPFSTG